MRRVVVLLMLVAAVLLGGVPAQAIIGGVPDGNEHPNVGAVIWHFGDIDRYVFVCSGSLLTPTIFVTAGHCDPAFQPPEWQTTVAGVTFTSSIDPFELDPSSFVPASQFVRHPDLEYDPINNFVNILTPDLGVIHLLEPAPVEPVALPAAGLIDQIRSEPAFRRQLLTQVGYGVVGVTHGGGPPQSVLEGDRKYASKWLRQAPDVFGFGLNALSILTTAHPGGPGGNGGKACYGDSGGPLFLGDETSNVQVGVFSSLKATGPDFVLCGSPNLAVRLDTTIARDFLCAQGVTATCAAAVTASQGDTPEATTKKATKVGKESAKKKSSKGKRGDHKHPSKKHKARRH